MKKIRELVEAVNRSYQRGCIFICESALRHPAVVCALLIGLFVLPAGEAFAGGGGGGGGGGKDPIAACNKVLEYLENGFASLVAAAAGLGAIIAAAVGGFKAAWSLLVVSVGAFILRAYIGFFLKSCS